MLLPKRICVFLIGCLVFSAFKAAATPITIDPGAPQTVCPCDSVILGGSPTANGGDGPPYKYQWSPGSMMKDSTVANPHVKVCTTTTFTLMVIDTNSVRHFATVTITVDSIVRVNAGTNASVCFGGTAPLGSLGNPAGVTYQWSPSTFLSCITCADPIASNVTSTTTYTLIAKDAKCSDTSHVTVTVLPPAPITTISPVTVDLGNSVTLDAGGCITYSWSPTSTLTGFNTATPTANPTKTTTYTVVGTDAAGCIGIDSVVVVVIEDSSLVFYNTFTPNGDGINDTWYIGNIELYPNNEVLIFNRYGKQVYRANGYHEQWDGSFLGTLLPDATYYYIVYTGTGKTYKGSVTIIRKPQ